MADEAAQNGSGPNDFAAAFNGSAAADLGGADSARRPVDSAMATRKQRMDDNDSGDVPSLPKTVLTEDVVSGVSSVLSMYSRGVPAAWHDGVGVAVNLKLVHRDRKTAEESKTIDRNRESGHHKKKKAGIHVEYTRMARDGVLRFPSQEMTILDEDVELGHHDITKTGIHVEHTRMAKDGVLRLPSHTRPSKTRPLPEKRRAVKQQGNNTSSDIDADVLIKRRIPDTLTSLNHPATSQRDTDEIDRLNQPTRRQEESDLINKQRIQEEIDKIRKPSCREID